uniref:Uncharacterized protein n=1 Tax=Oryzias latipes TaxID=8090 RepID=A0A3B3HQE4_ORYLA
MGGRWPSHGRPVAVTWTAMGGCWPSHGRPVAVTWTAAVRRHLHIVLLELLPARCPAVTAQLSYSLQRRTKRQATLVFMFILRTSRRHLGTEDLKMCLTSSLPASVERTVCSESTTTSELK